MIKPSHAMNMLSSSKGMGLYIHIPFCASKCAYCDFLSFEGMGEGVQSRYVDSLILEMQAAMDVLDAVVDTVYIGGGTPTTLPSPLLCEILREVQRFNLAPDAEITLEMNPCTNPAAMLSDYKNHGVNRLSIGLQAWQDHMLAGLKRIHTADDFSQTMQTARAADIDNINVDLMFALPGQTMDDWRESIAQVIAHGPEHVSAYSLTPAAGTPLWDGLEAGRIHLPDEAVDRAMYHEAIKMLAAAGYGHYELSNFALPGRESRHNIDCWRRKPYRGFGLGAHSFDGLARWRNTLEMGRYLSCSPSLRAKRSNPDCYRDDVEILSQRDAMAETMILGLRMTDGVNPQDFYHAFGVSLRDCYGAELETLVSKGLLINTAERVALTPLGLDLANQVFAAFL